MLTLPNPLPTDLQSLRQLYIECCDDAQGGSSDATKGASRVKLLYPNLIAAMNSASDASRQVVENDDKAQRAAIPQPIQDNQGLYKNATVEDISAVWKACGNSFDPSKASIGFDTLVDSFAKNQRLGYVEGERQVRLQFKALAALSDAQKMAAKLGVELPSTSTPGNPQWSAKTGLGVPPVTPKPLINPPVPFPPKSLTGVEALNVRGFHTVANADDASLQDEYVSAFNTPASRAAAISCLSKYLAYQGGVSEDVAKKSIPEKVPHMGKVYSAHLADKAQN